VSRPRRPFGPNAPGRLPATMIKVLAAEMSDAARLARGKRYWADDAVIDIVIGHGAVTAEVQGSRSLPYVVTLEARPGLQAPSRREVTVRCTCPDDDGTGRFACKHAVAALFALSDEVAVDPDVLARWRRTDSQGRTDDQHDHDELEDELPARGRDQSMRTPRAVPAPRDDTSWLGEALRAPAGAALPAVPTLLAVTRSRLPDRTAGAVLDDALAALSARWG
jgi:uncharacterized Zn finger protein